MVRQQLACKRAPLFSLSHLVSAALKKRSGSILFMIQFSCSARKLIKKSRVIIKEPEATVALLLPTLIGAPSAWNKKRPFSQLNTAIFAAKLFVRNAQRISGRLNCFCKVNPKKEEKSAKSAMRNTCLGKSICPKWLNLDKLSGKLPNARLLNCNSTKTLRPKLPNW